MSALQLTLAVCDYDHVRDFVTGTVRAEGLDINFQVLPVQEIFHRFTSYREWDVSEMSMGMYASLRSQGDDSLIAIPVFTSRVFRLSSFYVRRGGAVKRPEDLRGRRIGYPEWAHTAGVYSRAWLMHDIGIPLDAVEWIQSGVNQPGRKEHVKLALPGSVRRTLVTDRSLDQMLLAGEIDALMSSLPPQSFMQRNPEVGRLVGDFRAVEAAHFRRTSIFPIMHTIAIRRDVFDRNPWIAANLLGAFEAAKARSLERLRDPTISRFPFPWTFASAEEAEALFGRNVWPYGVDANRATLEPFLKFCHEQGLAHRRLTVDELFAPQVLHGFRV